MDGPEGETHVELGAKIMHKLFDWKRDKEYFDRYGKNYGSKLSREWYLFSICHSRFYAKRLGYKPSKLCFADKLAICFEPTWFYLIRVNLSGEVNEYMKLAESRNLAGEPRSKYEFMKLATKSQKDWFEAVKSYVSRWIEEHKDGKEDNWTPNLK